MSQECILEPAAFLTMMTMQCMKRRYESVITLCCRSFIDSVTQSSCRLSRPANHRTSPLTPALATRPPRDVASPLTFRWSRRRRSAWRRTTETTSTSGLDVVVPSSSRSAARHRGRCVSLSRPPRTQRVRCLWRCPSRPPTSDSSRPSLFVCST